MTLFSSYHIDNVERWLPGNGRVTATSHQPSALTVGPLYWKEKQQRRKRSAVRPDGCVEPDLHPVHRCRLWEFGVCGADEDEEAQKAHGQRKDVVEKVRWSLMWM